jgi:hypothetical protein
MVQLLYQGFGIFFYYSNSSQAHKGRGNPGGESLPILIELGTASNVEGIALVDYLHKIPSMMTLNEAQIVELEQLLNKAGDTLGMSVPFVPPATEEEKVAVLQKLALSVLQTKPKVHYQKYLDMMKAAGKPVTMTQQEFLQFAQQTLGS